MRFADGKKVAVLGKDDAHDRGTTMKVWRKNDFPYNYEVRILGEWGDKRTRN